ncbi:hypothetical protein CHS0354_004098 [Potamilus streckersoni]|uniref:C-type lectin domain-containing protein n=1 Tax=Potamilus streckersoni TaxID=2493646 RepID=A0AAE0VWU3_9BIVA|nr:hypothetical protein CHS0354_004098 [Potamilus streckersoni]
MEPLGSVVIEEGSNYYKEKYFGTFDNLIVTTITTSTTDASVDCPTGYTRIISPSNTCYFLEKTRSRNWTDAKMACEQNNGYLMALKTSELHNYMKSVIQSAAVCINQKYRPSIQHNNDENKKICKRQLFGELRDYNSQLR